MKFGIENQSILEYQTLQEEPIDGSKAYNISFEYLKRNRIYNTDLQKVQLEQKVPISKTILSSNPNIENTIQEYVTKHLREYLQENNYNVFMSGGVDSENVANILINSNVRFNPVIVAFGHKDKVLNDYDISYAFQYCKRKNLTPEVIDIDIIDFFNSGKFKEYTLKYQNKSPQFAPLLYAFEKIDGNIIHSGHPKIFSNFLHIARTKSKELEDVITDFEYSNEVFNDVNFYTKDERQYIFDRYLLERKDQSISDFYNCTTDMALTFTNNMIKNTDVTLQDLLKSIGLLVSGPDVKYITNEISWKDQKEYQYNFKIQNIYIPNNLFARPRTKFTGFEGIKRWYSDKYIGKDLTLERFDKFFRDTLNLKNEEEKVHPLYVDYIMKG